MQIEHAVDGERNRLLVARIAVVAGIVAVRAAVARYAMDPHRRRVRVVRAALGGRAGTVGAGLAAWELLRRGAAG